MSNRLMDRSSRERALAALAALPRVALAHYPTPVEELTRLRAALGGGPRLLVKRDDAISFGFGGNKVRKVELVVAEALEQGADTLVTTGGTQSNHARATAAAAAKLGLKCVLVLNGARPARPTANTLLDVMFGADVHYVERREDRAPAMAEIGARLREQGHRPVQIPLGASTPLGALGIVRAVGEVAGTDAVPDFVVHSTSSGGTQSGLIAGCVVHGMRTRVIGISADTPAAEMRQIASRLLSGIAERLGVPADAFPGATDIEVDDRFVGEGYGVPTAASREAADLLARTEALVVDQTYTAKALAGLIAWIREGRFRESDTVMFWHTGGQTGIFAE